jgi:hypothetical protein
MLSSRASEPQTLAIGGSSFLGWRGEVDVVRRLQHDEPRSFLLEAQGGGLPAFARCNVERAQVGLQPVEEDAVALVEVSIATAVEEEQLRVRPRRGHPDPRAGPPHR